MHQYIYTIAGTNQKSSCFGLLLKKQITQLMFTVLRDEIDKNQFYLCPIVGQSLIIDTCVRVHTCPTYKLFEHLQKAFALISSFY